jgi:hypothetical protein
MQAETVPTKLAWICRQSLSIVAVVLLLLAGPAVPSAEARQSYDASDCVAAQRSRSMSGWDQIAFRNVCDGQIFIIYCGQLQFNRNVCDGSRASSYFSHSINLRAGQSHTVDVQSGGWLEWGACEGSIGFENNGHFSDDNRGTYSCLR